jgi:hypothetical protein
VQLVSMRIGERDIVLRWCVVDGEDRGVAVIWQGGTDAADTNGPCRADEFPWLLPLHLLI